VAIATDINAFAARGVRFQDPHAARIFHMMGKLVGRTRSTSI